MAATLTETRTRLTGDGKTGVPAITRIELAMVSHTDGTVAGLSTAAINGTILRWTTNPGATAPDANWDITLLDEDGIDVLAGLGANQHTSSSTSKCGMVVAGDGTNTSMVPFTAISDECRQRQDVLADPLRPLIQNGIH